MDLAPLAKAGTAWAVNELLRRALPDIRAIVGRAVARMRKSFDVYDDAVSEGIIATWRCIGAWDPSRGPLARFARVSIQREVRRVVAKMGHAVEVPLCGDVMPSRIVARQRALASIKGIEEPAVSTQEGWVLTYADVIPAPSVSVDDLLDVERITNPLSTRDAALLLRVAAGETYAEVGEDAGDTKQCVHIAHQRAMQRARRAASACFRR